MRSMEAIILETSQKSNPYPIIHFLERVRQSSVRESINFIMGNY